MKQIKNYYWAKEEEPTPELKDLFLRVDAKLRESYN